jgi:TfoX/Sxy family transcriptional regulator of competence genes
LTHLHFSLKPLLKKKRIAFLIKKYLSEKDDKTDSEKSATNLAKNAMKFTEQGTIELG